MTNHHTTPEPPPFDPDPELVADVENNWWALRAFRKAATEAHNEAERLRAEAAPPLVAP